MWLDKCLMTVVEVASNSWVMKHVWCCKHSSSCFYKHASSQLDDCLMNDWWMLHELCHCNLYFWTGLISVWWAIGVCMINAWHVLDVCLTSARRVLVEPVLSCKRSLLPAVAARVGAEHHDELWRRAIQHSARHWHTCTGLNETLQSNLSRSAAHLPMLPQGD